MIRPLILILACLCASVITGYSQDCAVKLQEAEEMFNSGKVELVPALLENCLESGFTKEESMAAYKLIIRSYLFDDRTDLAEEAMLEFLRKRPEYEISPTDNDDFIYLFNKYRVKPVVQLGLTIGANSTFISVVSSNSVSGDPAGKDYSNDKFSLAAGLDARIKLNPKLELGAGVGYSQVTFTYSEPLLNFATAVYNEKQTRIEFPVVLYLSPWQLGKFSPYFKGGAAASMNLSTVATPRTDNIDVNNTIPRTGQPEERTDSRKFFEAQAIAGLGCRYKLPMSYLFVDVSSVFGTMVQSHDSDPGNLEFFYGETDDVFRLNNLRISFGFIFIFYKPYKIED